MQYPDIDSEFHNIRHTYLRDFITSLYVWHNPDCSFLCRKRDERTGCLYDEFGSFESAAYGVHGCIGVNRCDLTVRLVSCMLCGIAAGILVAVCFRKKKFFDFTDFEVWQSRDTDSILVFSLKKISDRI